MDPSAALRDFLVSRRARLRPEDVGLAEQGPRRVAGLRREEVAALAAVSLDHYIRLERGQASRVSDTVLQAVASALRLTSGERRYLFALARSGAARGADAKVDADAGTGVRPSVQSILDSLADTPAYLVGRNGLLLAWNRPAVEVFLDFAEIPAPRRLIGRLVFGDPRSRLLYADWEAKAREVVGFLRTQVGNRPHDPALAAHIRELLSISADFRRLWSAQDVLERAHGSCCILHPTAGPLMLNYETLQPFDTPEKLLVVYAAEPGSASAAAVRELCARTRVDQ
ncbi:helix-turn-helix transcriptional regulator [Embleya sp. NPDC005971]|uniref:helix-turn-helix domain-containing protein n=1 Tax=Embleya sp. NPDC005971 TaxID=3156724 RepID=UPI0033F657AB